MRKSILAIGAIMMMAACTQTSKNPFLEQWNTPYGVPPFDKIQLSDYIPAIKAGIEEQNKELDAIINNSEAPTFENTVAAYELSGQTLDNVSAVLFNLDETEGNDEMNKVVEEATSLITEHSDNISMNKDFFNRVKAVYDGDQSKLTREQQMVLKKLYQSFTRNGVDLDDASQARLKEINQKLAAASQKFGTNLLAE
ncbi:MAG: peptidase M3, partial [Candidatus Cryptobacteroides sp.]|nr:peptidase M3 [Candidatus Cryptobacteroides sp.]